MEMETLVSDEFEEVYDFDDEFEVYDFDEEIEDDFDIETEREEIIRELQKDIAIGYEARKTLLNITSN
jgi:hypothetical protein